MILCRIDYLGYYCELDVVKKYIKKYSRGHKPKGDYVCDGLYYEDTNTFFALYCSRNGPMIFFEGKEYPLTPLLSISVERKGEERHFSIKEYDIEIDYPTSEFIDMDVWSTEEDVDLFVNITNNYRSEEFYEKYTLAE